MLLGYQLNIYTDHKNLTFSSFQADCTICWRLLYVEELGPTFFYVKGDTNTGADALSRLNLVERDRDVTEEMEEVYRLENEIICPIAYHVIQEAQNKEFTEDERNQWPTKYLETLPYM
jgi:hypothetical protein